MIVYEIITHLLKVSLILIEVSQQIIPRNNHIFWISSDIDDLEIKVTFLKSNISKIKKLTNWSQSAVVEAQGTNNTSFFLIRIFKLNIIILIKTNVFRIIFGSLYCAVVLIC